MGGGEPDRLHQVVQARIALGCEAEPIEDEPSAPQAGRHRSQTLGRKGCVRILFPIRTHIVVRVP